MVVTKTTLKNLEINLWQNAGDQKFWPKMLTNLKINLWRNVTKNTNPSLIKCHSWNLSSFWQWKKRERICYINFETMLGKTKPQRFSLLSIFPSRNRLLRKNEAQKFLKCCRFSNFSIVMCKLGRFLFLP